MNIDVKYKVLYPKVRQINEEADHCYVAIHEVYDKIVTMHETWDGNQWNNFVTTWTELVENLNNNLKYIVKTAPESMEAICVNYSIR